MRVQVKGLFPDRDGRDVQGMFRCQIIPGFTGSQWSPPEEPSCEIYEGTVEGRLVDDAELEWWIGRHGEVIREEAWTIYASAKGVSSGELPRARDAE